MTDRARLVINCLYSKDPRKRRCVVTALGAHPIEVCEHDALGNESWRIERDPPAAVRIETLLAKALMTLNMNSSSVPLVTVDLGRLDP